MPVFQGKDSFTLIELLIVTTLLAILGTVVVVVLNPAEMMKQSRDSQRLVDLNQLNKVLSFIQVDQPALNFGSSSVVYVSIPDASSSCANLGLPSLPSGWSYACSNSFNYKKINGNGWVPVNFTQFSGGSPLSKLPIDPVNATSTGEYYTYVTGGSWELSALLTSTKYSFGGDNDKEAKDGGDTPELFEIGNNLSLLPVNRDSSLVGYWKFDEGSGSSAYDASGKGNTGTLYDNPTWQSESSCKIGKCLRFIDSNNRVGVSHSDSLHITGKSITVSLWVYMNSYLASSTAPTLLIKETNNPPWGGYMIRFSGQRPQFAIWAGSDGNKGATAISGLSTSRWAFIAGTFDGSAIKTYVDGDLAAQQSFSGSIYIHPGSTLFIPQNSYIPGRIDGSIDDVRIYNRALSAAEIQAIYNATK